MQVKNKSIVTIFIDIENIHLIKDPGMIPLTLHKDYGYEASILLWSHRKYPCKDIFYKDIHCPIINLKKTDKKRKVEVLKWLFNNAEKYSILHLYFFERWSWIYIWAYKLINKKGIIYVHCDTDGQRLLNYKWTKNKLKLFIIKNILLTNRNLKDVLWGVQNKKNCKRLIGTWPFFNIKYIPNGVWWENNIDVDYSDKENTILTVARNGTPPKRTELLLEGFAAVASEFSTWKLQLVGTVEKSFEKYIEYYFIRNPELKSRVIFSEEILDRNELQKIYSYAKVFCLTSAYESFGLVTIEALSCGCYVIESDIPANKDVTQNGKYGSLFKSEDLNDFIEQLRLNLSDEEHMKKVSEEAKIYIENNFTWKKVLEPVNEWICKKQGE